MEKAEPGVRVYCFGAAVSRNLYRLTRMIIDVSDVQVASMR